MSSKLTSDGHLRPADVFLNQHLQELAYENALLKQRLNEVVFEKDAVISDLEKRLGKCEYELENSKSLIRQSEGIVSAQVQCLHERDADLQTKIDALTSKLAASQKSLDSKTKQVGDLERFLAQFPTLDELQQQTLELQSTQKKVKTLRTRLTDLNNLNYDLSSQLQESNMQKLTCEDHVSQLKNQVAALSSKLEKTSGVHGKLTSLSNYDTYKDTAFEVERYKQRYNDCRKILAAKQHQLEALNKQLLDDARAHELKCEELSATIEELKDKLLTKQQEIGSSNKRTQQVMTEKQDLLDQLLMYKVKADELDRLTDSGLRNAQARLMSEVRKILTDLTNLTEVTDQVASGREPDLQLLFTSSLDDVFIPENSENPVLSNIADIDSETEKLRSLRDRLDSVRHKITEHYATKLSDDMQSCIMQ